jgi:hypothetical protein
MTYSLALMGWLKRLLLSMSEAGYSDTWLEEDDYRYSCKIYVM